MVKAKRIVSLDYLDPKKKEAVLGLSLIGTYYSASQAEMAVFERFKVRRFAENFCEFAQDSVFFLSEPTGFGYYSYHRFDVTVDPRITFYNIEKLTDEFMEKWRQPLSEIFYGFDADKNNQYTLYVLLLKTIRHFKLTGFGSFKAFEKEWNESGSWEKERIQRNLSELYRLMICSGQYQKLLDTTSDDFRKSMAWYFAKASSAKPWQKDYAHARDFFSNVIKESETIRCWFDLNYSFFTDGPDPHFEAQYPSDYTVIDVCCGLYMLFSADYKRGVKAFAAALKIINDSYDTPSRQYFFNEELYDTLFVLAIFFDRNAASTQKKIDSLLKKIDTLSAERTRYFVELILAFTKEGEVSNESLLDAFVSANQKKYDYLAIFQLTIASRIIGPQEFKNTLSKIINSYEYVPPFLLREALAVVDPSGEKFSELNEKFRVPLLLRDIKHSEPWELSLEKLLALSKTFEKKGTKTARSRIAYLVDPKYLTVKPYLQKSKDGLSWNKGTPIAMSTFMKGMPEMDETDKIVAQMPAHVRGLTYALEGLEVFYELAGCGRTFSSLTPLIPFEIERDRLRLEVKKDAEGSFEIQSNLDEEGFLSRGNYAAVNKGPHAMAVFKYTDKEIEAVNILEKLKRIPSAGEKTLTQILENISSEIPVSSELLKNSETLPVVQASSDITFRFQPNSGATEIFVKALIKPASGCDLTLQPGVGLDTVAANVNKVTTRLERNLKLEKEHWENLSGKLEAFDAWKDEEYSWVLDTEHALEFMEVLRQNPAISRIEWPEGVKLSVNHTPIDFPSLKLNLNSVDRWFSLDGTVSIDGKTQLKINEILDRLKDRVGSFICLEGKEYIAITNKLRRQLEWLEDISSRKKDKLNFSRFSAQAIEDLRANGAEVKVDKAYRDLQKRIEASEEKEFKVPALASELRPYQEEGFLWLSRLADWGAGAILADDMGLGKTIQAIALLASRKSLGTSLVVVPTSVLFNWKSELGRFAPALRVGEFNSGDREEILSNLKNYAVVLCTYGVLNSEIERLEAVDWNVVVLDEAHFIKNKATQTSHAVMKLKSHSRILLSGTPIQNHLSEIWNLFEFANPGYLGSFQQFGEKFILPIEKKKDKQKQLLLKQLISPFILRRTKADVLEELPEKTELTIPIELSEEEMAIYENIRTRTLSGLQTEKVNPIEALMALTKLRQAACSPQLVDKNLKIPSTKTQVFLELVKELKENNHRALVFSQFTSHLAQIKAALDKEGIEYLYMDGSVPAAQRKRLTEEFQKGTVPLFLISLKAGGTGLNLTGADYVIHLDPWWNPAVEDQASDRAYRIGQKRAVTIYKLIAQKTVEEKIIELHKTKKNLADALLEGSDVAKQLTKEEILELLQKSN